MINIDVNPFGNHDKPDVCPDKEKHKKRRLTDSYINSFYRELSKHYSWSSDATHYDNFRFDDN